MIDLRIILKAAFDAKVEEILIPELGSIQFKGADTTEDRSDLPHFDKAKFLQLTSELFAKDKQALDQGFPVQSLIKITGQGDMPLFIDPNQNQVRLFLPNTDPERFERAWNAACEWHEKNQVPSDLLESPQPHSEIQQSTAETSISTPAQSEPPSTSNFAFSNLLSNPSKSEHEVPSHNSSPEPSTPKGVFDFGSLIDQNLLDATPTAPMINQAEVAKDAQRPLQQQAPQIEPASRTTNIFSSFLEEAGGLAADPVPKASASPTPKDLGKTPQKSEALLPRVEAQRSDTIHFTSTIPDHAPPPGDHPINDFLRTMLTAGASDLHLTMGQPAMMRVDGDIIRSQNPIDASTMERLLLPIMPPINQREFSATHDTDFSYEIKDEARFRVNIFRDRNGVGAVLRQIPNKVLSADELELPEAIRQFTNLSKGLVLVTGPTGSGKSTTLAAMIDLINQSRSEHIITIEDPIEFVHEQKKCLINQREVHTHTESFSKALRAALREDPDIVLIGEMRDLETISIAIETAETGHLVFGTLHTTTAVSTVDRIIDQFPEAKQNQVRTMLAGSLRGVVSQVLLKKNGGGRIAAHEIMVVSPSIAALIRDKKIHMIPNDMQTKKQDGNQLMNEALLGLVQTKAISADEATRKSTNPEQFRQLLAARGLAS